MGGQRITSRLDLRKYRTELPNLYDDADLDPYEFRLLAHYVRVGSCWESVRTTAKKCHMSIGQVFASRNSLKDKRFINTRPSKKNTIEIVIVDIWAENFARYSKRSPHERDVHSMNTPASSSRSKRSLHEPKNRRNNQEESTGDVGDDMERRVAWENAFDEEKPAKKTLVPRTPLSKMLKENTTWDGFKNAADRNKWEQYEAKNSELLKQKITWALDTGFTKSIIVARILTAFETSSKVERKTDEKENLDEARKRAALNMM